jgi:hypothetical protein
LGNAVQENFAKGTTIYAREALMNLKPEPLPLGSDDVVHQN